jgi:PAS domain S-box-containing protein
MVTPRIAVILTDPDRRIIWVNEDFTFLTGYSLGEVMGQKPSILQGPKSETEVIQRIRKGLENRVPVKETITNYRKSGEDYQCRLVIHPIFNQSQSLINFIAFEADEEDLTGTEIPILKLSEKYSSSSLKGTEEMKLYFRLKELVETEKLYLDPNLTLKALADKLNTNTKYLSQVVNHYAGTNFQQLINSYRVQAVKRLIRDGGSERLTLFGVAAQCGFKNKSTFYKVFKEVTHLTPKEYMKEQV